MTYCEIYCDDAERRSDARLWRKKTGKPCGHQYFCMGQGWCKLNGSAMGCDLRGGNRL